MLYMCNGNCLKEGDRL